MMSTYLDVEYSGAEQWGFHYDLSGHQSGQNININDLDSFTKLQK